MPVVRANVAIDFGQGGINPILDRVGSDLASLVTSGGNNQSKTIECPEPDSRSGGPDFAEMLVNPFCSAPRRSLQVIGQYQSPQ
jgi:hypothetical protein